MREVTKMTDYTSLDRIETAHHPDLPDDDDELINYVNAYIYSGFFGT